MSYGYTYTKEETNNLKKEGDYEVFIEDIAVKTLPSGTEKVGITFRIRDDVEQAYKNGVIFEDIWHEKEHPEYFNRKRINQLLGTQHIEDGKVFEDINAVFEFLKGAKLCVHLVIELNDYNNQERNVVKYYKSTQVKEQTLGTAKNEPVVNDIMDEDLPF